MLAVAYRCQFEPHHLECIRIARSREFGALKVIDAYFGFHIEPSVWRLKRVLSGGGALLDLGVYALQVTHYLTGEEPIWVSGITTSSDLIRFSEVEESVLWEARSRGVPSVIAVRATTRRPSVTSALSPSGAGSLSTRHSTIRVSR